MQDPFTCSGFIDDAVHIIHRFTDDDDAVHIIQVTYNDLLIRGECAALLILPLLLLLLQPSATACLLLTACLQVHPSLQKDPPFRPTGQAAGGGGPGRGVRQRATLQP